MQFPSDDGTCATFDTEKECSSLVSILDETAHRCEWKTETDQCVYLDPVFSIEVCRDPEFCDIAYRDDIVTCLQVIVKVSIVIVSTTAIGIGSIEGYLNSVSQHSRYDIHDNVCVSFNCSCYIGIVGGSYSSPLGFLLS